MHGGWGSSGWTADRAAVVLYLTFRTASRISVDWVEGSASAPDQNSVGGPVGTYPCSITQLKNAAHRLSESWPHGPGTVADATVIAGSVTVSNGSFTRIPGGTG